MSADAYVTQFDDFLDSTQAERQSSELVRDYLNHKQWTSEEAKVLKDRGQAPVVKNIMRRKHDQLALGEVIITLNIQTSVRVG